MHDDSNTTVTLPLAEYRKLCAAEAELNLIVEKGVGLFHLRRVFPDNVLPVEMRTKDGRRLVFRKAGIDYEFVQMPLETGPTGD